MNHNYKILKNIKYEEKKMMQLIFPPIVINTLLYIAFAYFILNINFYVKYISKKKEI